MKSKLININHKHYKLNLIGRNYEEHRNFRKELQNVLH